MGQLALPELGGKVYVETSAVIYTIEKYPDYLPLLKPLWLRFEAGTLEIVSSELTLMETLVAPLKNADDLLEDAYENLLAQIRLIPIALPILREAARLRAETNLKTPDALHAATALLASCQMFVTNDYDYKRVPGLPAVILREILES